MRRPRLGRACDLSGHVAPRCSPGDASRAKSLRRRQTVRDSSETCPTATPIKELNVMTQCPTPTSVDSSVAAQSQRGFDPEIDGTNGYRPRGQAANLPPRVLVLLRSG